MTAIDRARDGAAPLYAPGARLHRRVLGSAHPLPPDDRGTLIGLPRPYLVPSVDPARPLFQEIYYWDTLLHEPRACTIRRASGS